MEAKCSLLFTKLINLQFTDLLSQAGFKVQDTLQALITLLLELQDLLLTTLDTVLLTTMVVQVEVAISRIVLAILTKVLVTVHLKALERLVLTIHQLVSVSYNNINYIY